MKDAVDICNNYHQQIHRHRVSRLCVEYQYQMIPPATCHVSIEVEFLLSFYEMTTNLRYAKPDKVCYHLCFGYPIPDNDCYVEDMPGNKSIDQIHTFLYRNSSDPRAMSPTRFFDFYLLQQIKT